MPEQEENELIHLYELQFYLDEIIAISDDVSLDEIIDGEGNPRTNHEAIQRSRLKVDTRKWAMSKLAPKKYGDKIQQEIVGANGEAIQHAVSIKIEFDDE